MTAWLALVAAVVLNTAGAAGIKRGLDRLGPMPLHPRGLLRYTLRLVTQPVAAGGIVLFAVAPLGTAAALDGLPASVAYPVLIGLNLLLVIAVGVLAFGERLDRRRLLAAGLVGVGIVLVAGPA